MTVPHEIALPADRAFVPACARSLLGAHHAQGLDLSSFTVVLPNLLLAGELRDALAQAAGGALLAPRFVTLSGLADRWRGESPAVSTSRRATDLYSELESRAWVPESARWPVARSLVALFDELTEADAGLPDDEAAFLAQVERSYALRENAPLRLEARIAHALWRAESAGVPSVAAARRMALARAAENAPGPLYVLCERAPTAAQRLLAQRWCAHAPATLFIPDPTGTDSPRARLLRAAWPREQGAVVMQRATQLAADVPASPLEGQVRLLSSDNLEGEAELAVQAVLEMLARGGTHIALVALDRLTARRARALLERAAVLVEDETGWRLSTTRAAALFDAWLEVLSADGYHRDLLDLAKSPYVLAAMSPVMRMQAVAALERQIASQAYVAGLARIDVLRTQHTAPILDAFARARDAMPVTRATPQGWLQRMLDVLEALGARDALAADQAGRTVLDLCAARGEELRGCSVRLDLAEWRAWLNDELDAATFRDTAIESPVVLTSLAATRLRRFDAAVVIGADARQLRATPPAGLFGSPALRAELGLTSPQAEQQQLRDDLAWLMESCDTVTFTWQHLRGDEANPLASDLALLDVLHQQAYGVSLQTRGTHWPAPEALASAEQRPPSAPDLLPSRLSVSALTQLLACPYRFYAASMLALEPVDEVTEAMEKRDYGDLAHRVLARFHAACPVLEAHDDTHLAAMLGALVDEVFRPELARSFLAHAWMAKLRQRIPGYLAWARRREAEGWRVAETETPHCVEVALDDTRSVTIHGRLDRMDRRGDELAVLDYKTAREAALKQRLGDPREDLQLAAYTWLAGAQVTEAFYLALDEAAPKAVPLPDPQAMAQGQQQHLRASLAQIAAGAALPAFPADATCAYCHMAGLCRKDYQA